MQEFVILYRQIFHSGMCGPRYLSRDAIFAAINAADRCNASGSKDTIAFHHAWNRRRAWLLYKLPQKAGKDLSLFLLAPAAYLCRTEAADDRDRLCGLAGLSIENHSLDINYSWSVDEVYLYLAKSFITQHKSLDIMRFTSLFITISGCSLPS
jgi:hypothetical protein